MIHRIVRNLLFKTTLSKDIHSSNVELDVLSCVVNKKTVTASYSQSRSALKHNPEELRILVVIALCSKEEKAKISSQTGGFLSAQFKHLKKSCLQ